MKIVASIRDLYEDRKPIYDDLKEEVDSSISTLKQPNWHYESRVKKLESFALKAETGRFSLLSELEDFLGACLVVENANTLLKAETLIKKKFKLIDRRPRKSNFTHKDPSSFVFDDIRLYLSIPHDETLPEKSTDNVVFELQLKTFLQHAWSIATHDLVYKGAELSWSSNRIAYQVKAMLEHAELSISSADILSEHHQINNNPQYKKTNRIIEILKKHWIDELLPSDIVRLSENVFTLLQSAGLNNEDFAKICRTSSYIGDSPSVSLSPYLSILRSILEMRPQVIPKLAAGKFKLLIPNELRSELSNDIISSLEDQTKLIE